jgi:hypothetical protein
MYTRGRRFPAGGSIHTNREAGRTWRAHVPRDGQDAALGGPGPGYLGSAASSSSRLRTPSLT